MKISLKIFIFGLVVINAPMVNLSAMDLDDDKILFGEFWPKKFGGQEVPVAELGDELAKMMGSKISAGNDRSPSELSLSSGSTDVAPYDGSDSLRLSHSRTPPLWVSRFFSKEPPTKKSQYKKVECVNVSPDSCCVLYTPEVVESNLGTAGLTVDLTKISPELSKEKHFSPIVLAEKSTDMYANADEDDSNADYLSSKFDCLAPAEWLECESSDIGALNRKQYPQSLASDKQSTVFVAPVRKNRANNKKPFKEEALDKPRTPKKSFAEFTSDSDDGSDSEILNEYGKLLTPIISESSGEAVPPAPKKPKNRAKTPDFRVTPVSFDLLLEEEIRAATSVGACLKEMRTPDQSKQGSAHTVSPPSPAKLRASPVDSFICPFQRANGKRFSDHVMQDLRSRKSVLSRIKYRLAVAADVESFMALYDSFNEDDHHRLLVFPAPFQEKFLCEAIEKKRIYVAYDKITNEILAFIKMFIVENPIEQLNILGSELRVVSARMQGKFDPSITLETLKSCSAVTFSCDASFATAFDQKTIRQGKKDFCDFKYDSRDIFIYYGGAWTSPALRNYGVNFNLENEVLMGNEQLEGLMQHVYKKIMQLQPRNIFYIYGVVEANARSAARLRTFVKMIAALREQLSMKRSLIAEFEAEVGAGDTPFTDADDTFDTLPSREPIEISVYASETYKPAFTVINGNLVRLPDESVRKGRGMVIGYSFLKEIDTPPGTPLEIL